MPVESKRAETIFLAALEVTDAQARTALLERECGGDPELRQRVEALLQASQNPDSLLDGPAVAERFLSDPAATQALDGATDDDSPNTQDGATLADPTLSAEGLEFLAPPTKPGNIGQLGHYEIREVIGKGGFGTVFKAFDEKLHRVVAIKILSPELSASGSARQRFIREARTAAAVTHEHVVTIHVVDENHRPPYIVMQYVDGVTLQQKLDRVGALSLREILRIGMQTAEGLAAAHKQGLVHRDIKPANVLLENGVERVKITDFGLARAVDDASVTQSGTVAGTPMYMSPEQAEGLAIDHRSDLFSLGTVLYAMCTGHPPFRASGTHAVLKRVIEASPRPIREINSDIPDWLCDIIARLHAKEAKDRFQTAKEVAELLGQRLADVQAGRVIGRTEPSKGPDESPAMDRPLTGLGSPVKRALVTIASLLVLGFVFILLLQNKQDTPAPSRDRGLVKLTGLYDPLGLDKVVVRTEEKSDGNIAPGEVVTELKQDPPALAPLNQKKRSEVELPAGRYLVEIRTKPGYVLKKYQISPEQPGIHVHGAGSLRYVSIEVKSGDRIEIQVITESAPIEPGWVQLFNGRDLTGWTNAPYGKTQWKVKDGNLVATGHAALHFQKEFRDYHVRLKIKLSAEGTLGLDLRKNARCGVLTMIAPTNVGSIWRYDPAAHAQAPLAEPLQKVVLDPDEWATLDAIVVGKRVRVLVNGRQTAEHVIDDIPETGSPVLGTSMAGAFEILVSKIEIKELPPEEPGWMPLFNGADLTGWKYHPKHPGDWTVKNGILTSGGKSNYLYTERGDFADFHLRAEVQLESGFSALFFRTPFGSTWSDGFSQPGLNGYHVAISNPFDANVAGSIRGPGGERKTAKKGLVDWKKWHRLEILAQGNRIETWIDGNPAASLVDEKHLLKKGHIALQMLRPDVVVRYRKIEIKELPPDQLPQKDGSQSSNIWPLHVPDRRDGQIITRDALGKTTFEVQTVSIHQVKKAP